MKNNLYLKNLNILSIIFLLISCTNTHTKILNTSNCDIISFPVKPEVFIEGVFSRCEGIAFNGENKLFVAGDKSVWHVSTSGTCTKIFTASSNLGLAPIGDRDILFADFGPANAFDSGYNRDGVVWRVTPEGHGDIMADNMGDPNFITVFKNGSFIVSDDATDEIHYVDSDRTRSIFTQTIKHPNGMVLSKDESELYVAQIFKRINPYILDGRIWSLKLSDNVPVGEPQLLVDLGDDAANDGLALDMLGRIYVSCWNRGEIWRYDIKQDELVLIAQYLPGVASLAFGLGDFDNKAIYATSTKTGKVWKVPVGVKGAILNK